MLRIKKNVGWRVFFFFLLYKFGFLLGKKRKRKEERRKKRESRKKGRKGKKRKKMKQGKIRRRLHELTLYSLHLSVLFFVFFSALIHCKAQILAETHFWKKLLAIFWGYKTTQLVS